MRTTLDVDNDVLNAVNELAEAQGKTAGQIVSQLRTPEDAEGGVAIRKHVSGVSHPDRGSSGCR